MRFAVSVGTTLGAMSRNLHKNISLALFFCLVFCSSFLCGQDLTPPQLVSVAFAPTQVNVANADQVVNVDLHWTDDLTGVRDMIVSFSSPVSGQSDAFGTVTASSALISGTLNDGVFRVPVTFQQSAASGDWILFRAEAHDEALNFNECLATCLNQINAPTIVTVTAVTANNPPVVTNPGTQSNEKGDSVSLQIQASDPDGDTLTYSAIGLPPGLSINTTSALISGTLGLNTAIVSVSDGTLSTSVNFDWLVTQATTSSETVLVANFMNGNNAVLNSRVYLWNPSTSAGDVTVRVFTLPLSGGTAQELTATPLNIGTLGAKSALNIKLAEDILDQLPGITTPYTTDGGNLTLEFTIGATGVEGSAQVFSSSFAFGTYPLQEIPSTSAGSPTVLVANFMNGNNDALNSRVYLWNPSASAGDVTVRVFSLPLNSSTAQELTGTPLSLGTLGAKSALNIKLAEDILDQLPGITTPYTTDGGNLTLEFTIQAADVRGAAQVFNNSLTLAFGTYPMQVIQ